MIGRKEILCGLALLISLACWGSESGGCSAPTPPKLAAQEFSCEELWARQTGLELTAKYSEIARGSSDRFRKSVQSGEVLIDQAITAAKFASALNVGIENGIGDEFYLEATELVTALVINSMPIDGLDDAARREILSFVNTALAESIKTGMSIKATGTPIIPAVELSNKVVALWNANREIDYRNRDIVAYAVLTEFYMGDQTMAAVKQKFKLPSGASDDALYDAIAKAYGLKGSVDADQVATIIKSVTRVVDVETKSRMSLDSATAHPIPGHLSTALTRRAIVEKGSISVGTAMRILTSEGPEFWSARLREIHQKLDVPLQPNDIKRLAGSIESAEHVSNLLRLRRSFPDDLSLNEAMTLLKGVSESEYQRTAVTVMYHMRKPFEAETVIAIAGAPETKSYNYLFSSALDSLPNRITDDDAILLLDHSPKNRRQGIARDLRKRLVPPISPDNIRRMSGEPGSDDYSYVDVFKDLKSTMVKSISSDELFLLLEGTTPEDRRTMERMLIPLVHE